MTKIICIADTHGFHGSLKVPSGDILIHAGDMTVNGGLNELRDFSEWLEELPHTHKVVIAGNHDSCFQSRPKISRDLLSNVHYLENNGDVVGGFNVWGSPYTPTFMDWSFMADGEYRKKLWEKIPNDTDILITHGPPYKILDTDPWGNPVGCEYLRERIREFKPDYHIFGHIHENGGKAIIKGRTTFINCAVLDGRYKLSNKPVVIEI